MREEGIAVGSRTISPAEFRQHQETVNLAIELLYGLHNASLLSGLEESRARAARHGLLELREVLREAWLDWEAQARSLTR